jgi:hypothetical protein
MKGAAAEQIRVAITDTPGGGRPALFPPARTNPFPPTLMLQPSARVSGGRLEAAAATTVLPSSPRHRQSCPICLENIAEPSLRTCNQVLSSVVVLVDDNNHSTACLTASSWISAEILVVSKGTSSLPLRHSPAMYSGVGSAQPGFLTSIQFRDGPDR